MLGPAQHVGQLAAVGAGSDLENLDAFRAQCRANAEQYEAIGSVEVAKVTREAPSRTTQNNVLNGVNCRVGGFGNGRIGTLTGNSGAKNFGTSCIDSLDSPDAG